jgi:hypothetical protein
MLCQNTDKHSVHPDHGTGGTKINNPLLKTNPYQLCQLCIYTMHIALHVLEL